MLAREIDRWSSLLLEAPPEWRGRWTVLHGEDAPVPCETLGEALTAREAFYGSAPALVRRLPSGGEDPSPWALSLGEGPAMLAGRFSGARLDGPSVTRDCRIDVHAVWSTLDLEAVLALELPVVDRAEEGAYVYGGLVVLSALAPRGEASAAPRLPVLLRARPGPPAAELGREFLAVNRVRFDDHGRQLQLG